MKTIITIITILFFALQVNAQCWLKVSSGTEHTVAIATNGTLWAWGTNSNGQLGTGTSISFSVIPVQVGTANNWSDIAAGTDFTIAIRTSGLLDNIKTLWAWGSNGSGQLGDGTFIGKTVPTQIGTSPNWSQISASTTHSIAINDTSTPFTPGNKTLWGWGRNNVGQLGNGITANQNTPIQIGTAIDWGQVAAGGSYSIAQKTNGQLFAWGLNNVGQLGINSTATTTARTQIGTDSDWSSNIIAGSVHTLAIKNNGTLWAWGLNTSGQLGNGLTTNTLLPIQIGTATDWAKVVVGTEHTVALKTNGDVYTWGKNDVGQLGIGTNIPNLARNLIEANVASISARNTHSFVVKTEGRLKSWGTNLFGELGIGSTTAVNIPTEVVCPAVLSVETINIESLSFTIYPNPAADGLFSIQSKNEVQEVKAFDVLGKQIDIKRINDSFKIDASSGIYNLRIKDSNGIIQNKKLIIK